MRPGDETDADQRSGLGAVDGVDHFGGGLVVFGFEVEDLAADHAFDGAGGLGNRGGRSRRPMRRECGGSARTS